MALQFQTRFAGGNGRLLDLGGTPVPRLRFQPEPHGHPASDWFHFRLVPKPGEAAPHPTLQIVLENADSVGGPHDATHLRPVARSEGQDWAHLRPGKIEWEPDGRVSMVWEVDFPTVPFEIAAGFPYGRPEWETFGRKHLSSWDESVIGLTAGGHPLRRWSASPGSAASPPLGLYLLARSASGGTPGSWAMEGFLTELVRSRLATSAATWVVPMADPDGLHRGDPGGTEGVAGQFGSPPCGPEAGAIQRDWKRWKERTRPALILEFCGPHRSDAVVLAHAGAEVDRGVVAWANHLASALGDLVGTDPEAYSPTHLPLRTAAVRAAQAADLPALCIHFPHRLGENRTLSRKALREIGQKLGQATLSRLA